MKEEILIQGNTKCFAYLTGSQDVTWPVGRAWIVVAKLKPDEELSALTGSEGGEGRGDSALVDYAMAVLADQGPGPSGSRRSRRNRDKTWRKHKDLDHMKIMRAQMGGQQAALGKSIIGSPLAQW